MVVFTGGLEVGKEAAVVLLLDDYIIPAAKSVSPLFKNPYASTRLEAPIRAAADSRRLATALPQAALNISGKNYQLEPNALGWKKGTFFFEPGSNQAIIKLPTSPDLAIGLDNQYRLTNPPRNLPVVLKGRWITPYELELEYFILGDFIESTARIEFNVNLIKLSNKNPNFGGSGLV